MRIPYLTRLKEIKEEQLWLEELQTIFLFAIVAEREAMSFIDVNKIHLMLKHRLPHHFKKQSKVIRR